MPNDYEVLHTKIRLLRLREKYWTQADLARAANLSVAQVNRIEAGKHRPQLRSAVRIASALGVKVEDIVKFPEVD